MKKLSEETTEKWTGSEDEAANGWKASLMVAHRLVMARRRLVAWATLVAGSLAGAAVATHTRLVLALAVVLALGALYLVAAYITAYLAYLRSEFKGPSPIKIIEQPQPELPEKEAAQ